MGLKERGFLGEGASLDKKIKIKDTNNNFYAHWQKSLTLTHMKL